MTTPTTTAPPLVADSVVIRAYLHEMYGSADDGFLAIFSAPSKRTDWVSVHDLDRAALLIAQRCDEGQNVYHGMGLHPKALGPDTRGSADGVIALPGVWIDIDTKSRAHTQTALPQTIEDVNRLLAEFPLPPTLLIWSGHGLYAHWAFHEVLTLENDQERSRAASALRRFQGEILRLARAHGWKLDSTADLARVLRPPGVVNRKPQPETPPTPTYVLRESGERYTLDEFEDFLPDDESAPRTAVGGDAFRPTLAPILDGCAFLAHCRDDAAKLPEPEWHSMMSIVALCDDGEQSAHALSKTYPGYTPEETQQKFERAQAANKPIKCETLQQRHGDEWCANCAQRGRITSPIRLGYPRVYSSGRNGASASADAEPSPLPWEEPLPLPTNEHPEFPTQRLPPSIRNWVEEEAVATQTPPALPAMMAIGVASTAIAKRVAVEIRPGWREPTNTYSAVFLESGNRKTSVTQAAGTPLVNAQKAQALAMAPHIAVAQVKRDVAEKRLENLKKEQARKPVDDLALDGDIRAVATELASDALSVPVAPRYLVDDITPEKLADLMSVHDERMGVLSAEGGVFQVIAGRYGEGRADGLDLFLKGHSGDYLPIDRLGRQAKNLEAPAITLALAPQPEVLFGLARHPGFRGRGLMARFAYAIPASTVGRRKVSAPPVAEKTRRAYEQRIAHLLALSAPEGHAAGNIEDFEYGFQGFTLTLTDAAGATLRDFETWLEPQLERDTGALGDINDWGSKLAGLVARWAGIFHAIEHVQAGDEGEPSTLDSCKISEGTMARVIAIAKTFLIPHAQTAFALMGSDRSENRMRRVLGVVQNWEEDTITRRDIHQRIRRSVPDANDLDRPLALLEEYGYLRRLPGEATGPGRRTSATFAINPLCRHEHPSSSDRQGRDDVDTSDENETHSKTYSKSSKRERIDDNLNFEDFEYRFRGSQNAFSSGQHGASPTGEWTHQAPDDDPEQPNVTWEEL